jgi:hypothetical protein
MDQMFTRCECCNKNIFKKNFQRHCLTVKHLSNAKGLSRQAEPSEKERQGGEGSAPTRPPDEGGVVGEPGFPTFGMAIEDIEQNENFNESQDDDFMGLTNDTYVSPEETERRKKEEEKQAKERTKDLEVKMKQEKLEAMAAKKREKESTGARQSPGFAKKTKIDDEGATEILGRERRELLKKIQMYKASFPKLLGTFRVKKGASVEELQAYFEECDAIVATETIDNFVLDGVFQIIRVGEIISSKTQNYDFTGLSAHLKQNEQFVSLARQLYIKYTVFSAIPPEIQMIFIIASTAFVMMQQNKMKKSTNQMPIAQSAPPQ